MNQPTFIEVLSRHQFDREEQFGSSVQVALFVIGHRDPPRFPLRSLPNSTPGTLDTPHIIEAGGNTRSSTAKPPRPGQPRRAKYRLSNTLREMFFENKTFSPNPDRSPDLKPFVRRFCAKEGGGGSMATRPKAPSHRAANPASAVRNPTLHWIRTQENILRRTSLTLLATMTLSAVLNAQVRGVAAENIDRSRQRLHRLRRLRQRPVAHRPSHARHPDHLGHPRRHAG